MFTTPCFIRKNSPELRKKLEELGYQFLENGVDEWYIDIENCICLQVNNIIKENSYTGCTGNWNKSSVDCGDNEDLFLALAALRDDSDKNQWFMCDENLMSYSQDGLPVYIDFEGDWQFCENDEIDEPWRWHKASVEELIEHFKK